MGAPKGGNSTSINKTTATPSELSYLTAFITDVYQHSTPDLHNEKQVNDCILHYFSECERRGIRAGNMGLYAALGITRQDYNNAITGKSKHKFSPACLDLVKRAVYALGAYRENLALEGKIHPTTYIFMGKNHDNLEDYTRIEVTADSKQAPNLTPEQIAKQIEQDIPIDTDYKEV